MNVRLFVHLRSVTFGPSSRLQHIFPYAFSGTGIESVTIPDSALNLCDYCFSECKNLRDVTFGSSSKVMSISPTAFHGSDVEVRDLSGRVAKLCRFAE